MQVIEEIKDRLDIVAEIGRVAPLTNAGGRWKGLCPFHQEKTASFFVFPDSGRWKCFGCGAGGDLFDFFMRFEGWEMGEAIRELGGRAGVVLQPLTPEARKALATQRDREAVFAAAAEWLHKNLLSEAGRPGLAYARDVRGLSEETIKAHGLGYFGKDWDRLRAGLRERGIAVDAPAAVALVGWWGNVTEWWSKAEMEGNPPQKWVQEGKVPAMPPDLLIYPHVIRGRVVYLSGRHVEVKKGAPLGKGAPKSWNPRRELAGDKRPFVNQAWGTAAAYAVVVEGQMCALTLAQWGVAALALAGCEA